MNFISIAFAILVFLLPVRAVRSENAGTTVSLSLSPVYEEMVGNQVLATWPKLIPKGVIEDQDPFFVAEWNQNGTLAERIVAGLKRKCAKTCDWRAASLENWKKDSPFQGVILIGSVASRASPSDFRKAAAFFIGKAKNRGFLILWVKDSSEVETFAPILKEAGLESKAVLALRELEFVKDERGRQIVDLDSPEIHYRIFERLVRQGMNPVQAHPAVEEAIQRFRSADEPKMIIAGKK